MLTNFYEQITRYFTALKNFSLKEIIFFMHIVNYSSFAYLHRDVLYRNCIFLKLWRSKDSTNVKAMIFLILQLPEVEACYNAAIFQIKDLNIQRDKYLFFVRNLLTRNEIFEIHKHLQENCEGKYMQYFYALY